MSQANQAKRVILRVPESEMNYQDPNEFVRLYLAKFRPGEELDLTRHFTHHEPPSDIPYENPKVHAFIDLEAKASVGAIDQNFPHEIHAIRRGTDGMHVA